MQFEVMKKSHKKEIIFGVIVLVTIAIVFIVQLSFAKYKAVKNMPIVSGTINYKIPDFNIIAMYKNDGAGDVQISTMPTSGYTINESKSYCNLNGSKDNNARMYTDINGQHVMSKLTKGNKCYIYFDKELCSGIACKTILKNVTVKTNTPDFSKIATTNEGVFKTKDYDGDTYYWRGAVTNNYVKFANKYWRIIRINGDGTIRLIYQGTSATSTGTNAQIGTSAFNSSYNNNMYVGFKYTSGQVHGIGTASTILGTLNTWYNNNLASYASKLDMNAGFCGDRTPSSSSSSIDYEGGYGTLETYYGADIRLVANKAPVLTCLTGDFYTVSGSSKGNKSLTYPIGLISADEVSMAGGVTATQNKNYYLYTGESYWAMSPSKFYNDAEYDIIDTHVYVIHYLGQLGSYWVNRALGVRPVINLKADVTLTGKGTASDPFVVQ